MSDTTQSRPVKLTLTETAKLLGCAYPSALQLANRKDFPAFKCMGKWIVPYDRLLEWIDKNALGA